MCSLFPPPHVDSQTAMVVRTPASPQTSWKCFLCWKGNEMDASVCGCCRRPRNFAPTSLMDQTKAQPLALHGLASALHPFREEQIAALAEAGLDLLATDTHGWTALHCAARLGQDQVVVNLLSHFHQKGNDDDDDDGDDRASRLRLLLEATSTGGWRALHHGIAGGHLRVVEELLVADADVNARLAASSDSLTPLHLAAKLGHTRIVDILLQCGGDPRLTTHPLGKTALHLAIDGGPHVETVRLLCARHPELTPQCDPQGMAPLQQASLLSATAHATARREVIHVLENTLRERGAPAEQSLRRLPAFLTS